MSNQKQTQKQTIEGPIQVGPKTGYEIQSTLWNGKRLLSFRVGKLVPSKKHPGTMIIIPETDLYNFEDFMNAARRAKQSLERHTTQAFHRQMVQAQHPVPPAPQPPKSLPQNPAERCQSRTGRGGRPGNFEQPAGSETCSKSFSPSGTDSESCSLKSH